MFLLLLTDFYGYSTHSHRSCRLKDSKRHGIVNGWPITSLLLCVVLCCVRAKRLEEKVVSLEQSVDQCNYEAGQLRSESTTKQDSLHTAHRQLEDTRQQLHKTEEEVLSYTHSYEYHSLSPLTDTSIHILDPLCECLKIVQFLSSVISFKISSKLA